MPQSCVQCRANFEVNKDDLEMIDYLSPVIAGTKHAIPAPTLCPECRQQRRFSFRNDQHYYRNTCHLCKKSLISIYSPDKGIPVLCDPCFWSDKFDPFAYGRDLDLKRPFLEQFQEMRAKTPRLAIYHSQSENSEYTVHSSRNRNCYMASSVIDCEDVHYSDFSFESRDSMDLFSCEKMELCYECVFSDHCFGAEELELCSNVSDSTLCCDCKGSRNLVGCVALRNRENCILNQSSSAEECEQTRQRLRSDSGFRKEFEGKFEALKLRAPKPAAWMISCDNCAGNYLLHSKNAVNSYNMKHCEDIRYAYEGHKDTDCCDITRIGNGEMLYECAAIIDLRNGAFCNLTYQSDHALYCDNCQAVSDNFGCVAMKKSKYCILNKQYSKEEYEKLVPQIIESMRRDKTWGEFFPVTLSPFGYNETKANEWYPMTEKDVKSRGWQWSEYEQPLPKDIKAVPASALPNTIDPVTDDILKIAIVCEQTGKPFRVIAQELAFYRKKKLPLPHRSPHTRHMDRTAKQNPRILHDRACMKCTKAIKTTYAPDRSEIVYCEACYLKEVY